MGISWLGFNGGGLAYASIDRSAGKAPSLQVAQSVDIDADADDQENGNDDNQSRRNGRRVSVESGGCGAAVRVGRISLASCIANRSAASALRTFSRSSNNGSCRNSVSQSSTQSTTVNGVTRRVSQSNSTCQ